MKENGSLVLSMGKEFKFLPSLEISMLVSLFKEKHMDLESTSSKMELFIVDGL